jgi:4-diphosphocytidyl-2-C-methyl-D-erythritol kinase
MPRLSAPAKLNLTLEILSRRDDGYHTLRSLMLPVGLYDQIEVEPAPLASFNADDPALASEGNLIVRALAAAGATTPHAVRLEKHIPVGGGLGGGSSDAAAILRAAQAGALGPAGTTDWLAAARGLGSDVPFFLAGTAALVEGTGERVTPLGRLPAWWALIVRPPQAVGTADAYRLLDESRAGDGRGPSRPRGTSASLAAVDALQRADFAALGTALVNDFEAPVAAAYPAVAAALAALAAAGAAQPRLSGSGSCVFEDEAGARACAARLVPDGASRTFVVPFHHEAAWR